MKKLFFAGIIVSAVVFNGYSQSLFSGFSADNTCETQYPSSDRASKQQYQIGYEKCVMVYNTYSQAIIELEQSWGSMQTDSNTDTIERVNNAFINLHNLLSTYNGMLFPEKGNGIYGGDYGNNTKITILLLELDKYKKDINIKLNESLAKDGIKNSLKSSDISKEMRVNLFFKDVKANDTSGSGSMMNSGSTLTSNCLAGTKQDPKKNKCKKAIKKKIIVKKIKSIK